MSRLAKRVLVAVGGSLLLLLGLVLLVLPGPGVLVLIAGLALLATEFTWAERPLRRARDYAARAAEKVTKGRRSDSDRPSA